MNLHKKARRRGGAKKKQGREIQVVAHGLNPEQKKQDEQQCSFGKEKKTTQCEHTVWEKMFLLGWVLVASDCVSGCRFQMGGCIFWNIT